MHISQGYRWTRLPLPKIVEDILHCALLLALPAGPLVTYSPCATRRHLIISGSRHELGPGPDPGTAPRRRRLPAAGITTTRQRGPRDTMGLSSRGSVKTRPAPARPHRDRYVPPGG